MQSLTESMRRSRFDPDLTISLTHARCEMYCRLLTDEGLRSMATVCWQLTSLNLGSCDSVTDEGLRAVAAFCTQLTSLRLYYCHSVTDEGLRAVAAACTQLTSLSLSCCRLVTEAGVRPFKDRGCSVLVK
jgi:bacterioferritin-associated ferredoxin